MLLTVRPLLSSTTRIMATFSPKCDSYHCLQCVMAYGELLAALPPILQTCFSAPRFPDSGSPFRRAVRQAALPTFPRSSPATTAGPSFSLPLIYSRWTVAHVVAVHTSVRFLLVPGRQLWHGNPKM